MTHGRDDYGARILFIMLGLLLAVSFRQASFFFGFMPRASYMRPAAASVKDEAEFATAVLDRMALLQKSLNELAQSTASESLKSEVAEIELEWSRLDQKVKGYRRQGNGQMQRLKARLNVEDELYDLEYWLSLIKLRSAPRT